MRRLCIDRRCFKPPDRTATALSAAPLSFAVRRHIACA
ncbi:hypothetical protein BURPS668_A0020 [Burkholderia pseudomallei 668]|nr:hypothetical protein BURPS668_A0020 [Burkholderia pseudomallei 668]